MSVKPADTVARPAPSGTIYRTDKGGSLRTAIAIAVVFAGALAIALWQNLSRTSLELSLVFDSGHYFGSAQKLWSCWQYIMHHGITGGGQELVAALSDDLMLDGPVVPLIGSLVFLLLPRPPEPNDACLLIVVQSALQAGTAASLVLLGARLTGCLRWGCLAAVIWAFYPAAVIGAGKFLPETPTALVLVLLVLSLSASVGAEQPSLSRVGLSLWAAGFLSGLVVLLKPVVAPVAALVDILAVAMAGWNGRGRVAAGALVMFGSACALIPWLGFTQAATGHALISPQRNPTMNLVLGLDIETDGWGSLPRPPILKAFSDTDGTIAAALAIAGANPTQSVSLALRKTVRLWGQPWNDFKTKFLKIPADLQQWWHLLVISLALPGLIVFAARRPARSSSPAERGAVFVGLAALAIALGHLAYVAFVANPRYGFTAMPFFILFATYAASVLARRMSIVPFLLSVFAFLCLAAAGRVDTVPLICERTHQLESAYAIEFAARCLLLLLALGIAALAARSATPDRRLNGPAIFALGLLLLAGIAITAANSFDAHAAREWRCRLTPPMAAFRCVHAPAVPAGKPLWAMILIDGDAGVENARVMVNRNALDDRPHAAPNSAATGTALSYVIAKLLRKPESQLRQWRAVAVPTDFLNTSGDNTIVVEPGSAGSVTIFGGQPQPAQQRLIVPSITYFSPTKLIDSGSSLDGRTPQELHRLTPGKSICWLKLRPGYLTRDLSPAAGMQFGEYRILLVLGYSGSPTAPDLGRGPLAIL